MWRDNNTLVGATGRPPIERQPDAWPAALPTGQCVAGRAVLPRHFHGGLVCPALFPAADSKPLVLVTVSNHSLRARQQLDKYRIERRLSEGAWAHVYQALDTVEGVRVALKIPHPHLLTKEVLEDFRHEVRLTAQLDHAHILPLKNAGFVDGRFVIAFPLGQKTLADRLGSRLALRTALDYFEQLLTAVAYAHQRRIIHCDIKPENVILFPDGRVRLTDFGIAKVAQRTIKASGSGTVGYVAPEQAVGKPSFRSDVFSLGLLLYRMLTGVLPEWPYTWPPPGSERLRRKVSAEMTALIQRAIQLPPARRFADAAEMLRAFRQAKRRTLNLARRRGRATRTTRDWQAVRRQQFLRQYGHLLQCDHACRRCQGPVSEAMMACPWCGADRRIHTGKTRLPASCPRCHRGMKLDWKYCAWCYGPGFEPASNRHYTDVRYTQRCANPRCTRKVLMPFMRYCPWCRRKVRRQWKAADSQQRCASCGWGVLSEFWDWCPWCGKPLAKR